MKVLIRGCGLALLMVSWSGGWPVAHRAMSPKRTNSRKASGRAPTPVAKGGDATPPPTSDAERGLPSSAGSEYGQTKGAEDSGTEEMKSRS